VSATFTEPWPVVIVVTACDFDFDVVVAALCEPPQPARATAARRPAEKAATARADDARPMAADMRTGLIKPVDRTCGSAGGRCSRVEVHLALRRVPTRLRSHMT
jgi:hypothetical protein